MSTHNNIHTPANLAGLVEDPDEDTEDEHAHPSRIAHIGREECALDRRNVYQNHANGDLQQLAVDGQIVLKFLREKGNAGGFAHPKVKRLSKHNHQVVGRRGLGRQQ